VPPIVCLGSIAMILNDRPSTSTLEFISANPGAKRILASDVFSEEEPLEADESVRTDVGPVFSERLMMEHLAPTGFPSCSWPKLSNPTVGVIVHGVLGLILIIRL